MSTSFTDKKPNLSTAPVCATKKEPLEAASSRDEDYEDPGGDHEARYNSGGRGGAAGDDDNCPKDTQLDDRYDGRLRKVSHALKDIAPPGDFFMSGSQCVFPLPAFVVHGLGELTPPLASSVTKELVAHCHLAPYGREEKTLVDTQVRNTWELSADQFQLTNPAWCKFVQDQIVPSIRTPLGVNAGVQVEAKLYKMLLYEAGGKFKKHQDSEKEDGMFGTLVVVLPGRFAGGELVVHDPSTAPETSSTTTTTANNTKTHVWDAGSMDPFAIKFAAFYGDCAHEVKPVTSGYRLCLTYNLVNVGGSDSVPRFGGNHPLYAALKETLCEFFTGDQANPAKSRRADEEGTKHVCVLDLTKPETHRQCKFVYVLNHKYTQAGLSFEYLKNKDALVADCLARFFDESNGALGLYLCKSEYKFEWRGPEMSSYNSEDKELGEYEELTKRLNLYSPWIPHGNGKESIQIATDCSYVNVTGNVTSEVAPAGMFDSKSFKFDGKDEQLYTVNAGANLNKWYKSAALLIVPEAIAIEAQLYGGPHALFKRWISLSETDPNRACYGECV